MKKIYQQPEMEVTEAFTQIQILTDQSEPEGSSWVGGNQSVFDENEAVPEEGSNQGSLWED